MVPNSVIMREWQTLGPDGDERLAGRQLQSDPALHRIADELKSSHRLEILELAQGLEIRSSSWVGRLTLGDLTVTIKPKLPRTPLFHLLRYAYGLRDLKLFRSANYDQDRWTFQDLLIHQLAAEVAELLVRGLHRNYKRRLDRLQSPRGRIHFPAYVVAGGMTGRAALPCEHHPRTEDTPINRAILAGLRFAVRCTDDLELRTRLRRLIQEFDMGVSAQSLNQTLLQNAKTELDRRTHNYRPALTLITLLMECSGVAFDGETPGPPLPGFLFDMNRFFQALLSRFLSEHLEGFALREEHRLKGMFTYDPTRNPNRRSSPTPRPDFAVLDGRTVVALLDAKYRDLWERSLPRDMLYQLALYALSREPSDRRAVILYPTLNASAVEQAVFLQEPIAGVRRAEVILRPVRLLELAALLEKDSGRAGAEKRQTMAQAMVFGRDRHDAIGRGVGLNVNNP